LKQFIKDYFSFNKSERKGIIVLLIILLLVVISPLLFPLITSKETPDFSKLDNEIEKFERSLKAQKKYSYNYDSSYSKEFDYSNIDKSTAEMQIHPFLFNPNGLSDREWKQMGFSDKQIRTIKNYEAKGGKFFKKEDLKKIYSISESEYEIIEPYIQIPNENNFDNKEKKSNTNLKNSEIIELNAADTNDLKKLKGIGSAFAKRIIAYRNKLGGFIKKEQLLEVYGMDSIRFSGFSEYVSINKFLISKININSATPDELKKHPYLNYNIAASLVNYRKQHGNFKTIEEIKKLALITEKIFNKIQPYLTVN